MNLFGLFRKKKPQGMTRRIIHLEETDSTNRYMSTLLDDMQEDIIVAYSDYQTAGRGQGKNTWESERGKNLLFSVLIRPVMVPVAKQYLLSEMGALAVRDALLELEGINEEMLTLKWPNDIYYGDKKISGTLIETSVDSKGIKRCVFGVGIDVNQEKFVSDAPNPMSLKQILGRDIDIAKLLNRIIDSFEKYYSLVISSDYIDITALYHSCLYRAHGFHKYRDKDGEFEGSIVEVEDNGHLILRDRDGMIREYAFKEVEFII